MPHIFDSEPGSLHTQLHTFLVPELLRQSIPALSNGKLQSNRWSHLHTQRLGFGRGRTRRRQIRNILPCPSAGQDLVATSTWFPPASSLQLLVSGIGYLKYVLWSMVARQAFVHRRTHLFVMTSRWKSMHFYVCGKFWLFTSVVVLVISYTEAMKTFMLSTTLYIVTWIHSGHHGQWWYLRHEDQPIIRS